MTLLLFAVTVNPGYQKLPSIISCVKRPRPGRKNFLPRNALQCKARSCDRMSSVCRLSVRRPLMDCDDIPYIFAYKSQNLRQNLHLKVGRATYTYTRVIK